MHSGQQQCSVPVATYTCAHRWKLSRTSVAGHVLSRAFASTSPTSSRNSSRMFPRHTPGIHRTLPRPALAHAFGDDRLAAEHNGVTSLLWPQRCRAIPKRPPAHSPQVRGHPGCGTRKSALRGLCAGDHGVRVPSKRDTQVRTRSCQFREGSSETRLLSRNPSFRRQSLTVAIYLFALACSAACSRTRKACCDTCVRCTAKKWPNSCFNGPHTALRKAKEK